MCGAALSSEIKSSDCESVDLLSVFVAARSKSIQQLLLFRDYIYFLVKINKSPNTERLHPNACEDNTGAFVFYVGA